MAQVLVRNLDDAVVERLKARAAAAGRSLEAELREIVTTAARPSTDEILAELARIRAMSPPRPPDMPTAEQMIREDRDQR